MQAYLMKCRAKGEIKDSKSITMKELNILLFRLALLHGTDQKPRHCAKEVAVLPL